MQVTELENKGLKRKYRITVGADQINAQTEAELKIAGERVKIPGFRPGYIPMKILKQRYGQSVQQDVLKNVINQSTTDLVNQKKERPALTPQINIEEYKEEAGLTFTVEFESFPTLPEVNYDKITIDRNTFDVAEKDIDDAQERIAESSPKLVRAKEGTKAAKGQSVVIDFKGTIDGAAFPGGTAEKFRLELGSGQFIEGFEDQLIGIKEGENRTVNVKFPDSYHGKDVAGKKAAFEVKVHEILDKELPAVDDEFAKARGFADVASLRQAIKEQINNEYGQLVRNQLKKQLFDILEETYDFDLPQGMVDLEFNSIWERLQEAKKQGDESIADKDEAELKKEYRAIAERRVKLGLLLADIGNKNKIQISREELGQAVFQQARMYPGQERKVIEFYQKNPERADELRGPILEEKAVDFVLSKIKFNDKKISLDELAKQGLEDEDDVRPAKKSKAKKTEGAAKKPKKKDSDA